MNEEKIKINDVFLIVGIIFLIFAFFSANKFLEYEDVFKSEFVPEITSCYDNYNNVIIDAECYTTYKSDNHSLQFLIVVSLLYSLLLIVYSGDYFNLGR